MTTITPFAAGSYLTTRNASQLAALKNQLTDLSSQVSTGLVATTYGGLGSGRSTALAAQATLSALTGYAAGIGAAQTRTNLAVTSLTQVATLGSSARDTLNNGVQSAAADSVAVRSTALGNLQTALDTLNQSAAGNYLFGGSDTTTQPVADVDTVLNGTTDDQGHSIAGLTAVVAEYVGAAVGTAKNGRLTQVPDPASTTSSTTVQVTDEANSATRGLFGFTLAATPTVTGSALSATYRPAAASAPASFTLSLPSQQPLPGDSVTIALGLPDGTTKTLTLTAAASADSGSTTTFAIGSSPSDTMHNLSTTLNNALTGLASSTLAVNATAAAASSFFTGSVKGGPSNTGVMPERVAFDANNNPIGYKPASATDTVLWYQGENTYAAGKQTDAINTQSVQVSAGASIGTGARAIDPAVQNVLAGLATMAFALPTTNDGSTNATYQSVVDTAGTLLTAADGSSGVQDTVTQLSLASARLTNASSTNAATQNTVQNTLDGIEQAPTEEVVTKLLDVQNRLQASYQITATLSKLSLVNYIS
ncbi:flagellin [Methylobacterium sp. J-030]|uniref:flagellin n=1 Tax=Methylobacterium sp. J-030 TaxID=2836627 RepID=UPI001FB920FB|nr:flagellin [Methylobacterium sp. J-030]MCJ2071508.1 flagellin [Methylobacterium sp. J-030]